MGSGEGLNAFKSNSILMSGIAHKSNKSLRLHLNLIHLEVIKMLRRMSLLLFALCLVFLATVDCFADVATDYQQVETHVKNGLFNQAEPLCKSIIQNNPGSDYALRAQSKLVAVYVMTQRMTQADAEVDKLIADFGSHAELPGILYGVILRYKKAREHQRANNLSQRICQYFPSSEQVQRIQLDAGKEQVLSLIANKKYQQAEESMNSFVANSGSNSAMPAALYKIAREFKEAGRYDETIRIYQRIVQDYTTSKFNARAKMAMDKLSIWKLIEAGNVVGAQTKLEQLITAHSNESRLPHTVHGVALKFEENGYYSQARALYQRVIQDYASDKMASVATVDLANCDIRAMIGVAAFNDVINKLNALKNTFPSHLHLSQAVYQIGEEYYKRAMRLEEQGSSEQAKEFYRNATGVWDIVINQLPASSFTPEACCWSGDSYYKLAEYGKARDCYQKIIDSNPGYRFFWHVLFMLGESYENLKRGGTISESEANTKTKAAYEQLLEQFPNCSAVGPASDWLNHHSSK